MVIKFNVTAAAAIETKLLPFTLVFGKTSDTGGLPKLIYWVEIERQSKKAIGMASEFLMPGWFDKLGDKENYLHAMENIAKHAVNTISDRYNGRNWAPFTITRDRGDEFRGLAREYNTTALAAQMILAIEDRAILDALSRTFEIDAIDFIIKNNGFDIHRMDERYKDLDIKKMLRYTKEAPETFPYRHTVGLDIPIIKNDAEEGATSLEEQIIKHGINRFKFKIDDNNKKSIERLEKLAYVLDKYKISNPIITIDGNEAFENWSTLIDFAKSLSTTTKLSRLKYGISYIEQPFRRDLLTEIGDEGKSAIKKLKEEYNLRILIDESGDRPESAKYATEVGITGFGLKMCKDIWHGLEDVALAYVLNNDSLYGNYFNSGEDLSHAEPTDFPQALNFYALLKAIKDAELNGAFNTKPGRWMTIEERKATYKNMESIYGFDNEHLTLNPKGNAYRITKDILGPGLGGNVVFDINADVRELREKLAYWSD